jgi:hypothetical protein
MASSRAKEAALSRYQSISLSRTVKSLFHSATIFLLACQAHAVLDLNSDQVPDVWALVYNTGAISLTADSDGDGQTNAQEAAAGTNPFSPSSRLTVKSVAIGVPGVTLVFPSQVGKRYRAQNKAALGSGEWADEGSFLPGIAGDMTTVVNRGSSANKFYRVVASEMDSDNDGVSDWEEIALRFDPNNSHSDGPSGPDDLAAITVALTAPSVVSVTAIDNLATEPATGVIASDTASFVISRTGGLKALTVSYNTNNSGASAGSDYMALSGSVTFGLGVRSMTVTVVPLADGTVESPETVLCNLAAGGNYSIGGQSTASITINDLVAVPGSDVTTLAIEGTGTQQVSFGHVFRRGDVPGGQVPVLTDSGNTPVPGYQVQTRTFHADGSVRHAVMHGTVIGGQTYKVRAGTVASGTNKTVAGFLAAVPGSIARVLVTGNTSGICDLRDLLSNPANRAVMTHNATNNLRIIEQGPNVLNVLVSQNVGTHLRVTFEVRWYGGSVYWVDAYAINGYATLNGMGAANYTGQLEVNGSLVTSPQPFTTTPHYNHSAWHPGAELAGNAGTGFWSGAPGTLYVRPNTQYIQDSGAVPNYRRTQLPGAAHLNNIPQTCAAMDNCQMRDNLDDGGAGEELALLPRWCAVYIKSGGDIRAFRNMLANDNGGAAYPVFFVNHTNGELMTENEFPNASYNQETGFGSGMFSGQSPFGVSAVVSHHPSVGYVSYLVTGMQFYLDLMNAWTCEANLWNSTNRNLTFQGRTIRRYYEFANRGAAWQIRSNGHCAYINPDNSFLKPQFVAWIKGVATLYDVPHYGPGGTWRKTIGALYEGDAGAVNYSLFFHLFYAQATAWVALDLGFTEYLPVAQYAGILVAGLFGSTGEYPFENAPRDRLKLGATDQTASPESADYYANFTLVKANNDSGAIGAVESGTLAMAALLDDIDPGHTGLRNECRRQRVNDSYFANFLPALSYLHRLGIDGGFECWLRTTLCTAQPDFSSFGSQWDIGPREVPLPSYIRNAAPLTWTEMPGTILPTPPYYPGDQTARIRAWGGMAVKWMGSEIRIAAGGGHGDAAGNSVERLRLNAESPAWVIERNPTLPTTPQNQPYFDDGRPNSRHIYYDAQFSQGRNQHILHGASYVWPSAPAFPTVTAYSPAIQDYLPQNTYPNAPASQGAMMKAYNLANGCIYFTGNLGNDMNFSRWSAVNGTAVLLPPSGEYPQQYKAGACDPIRGIVLHACAREENFWRQYSIDNGAFTNRFPATTPGLTPAQQSALLTNAGSLEWDIRGRRYLHYVSGQEVFAINPDPTTGFTAIPIAVQGTPPPASTPHGIYSRARYVPELDIYVVVSNPNQNVYFFKFASTQRPLQ